MAIHATREGRNHDIESGTGQHARRLVNVRSVVDGHTCHLPITVPLRVNYTLTHVSGRGLRFLLLLRRALEGLLATRRRQRENRVAAEGVNFPGDCLCHNINPAA